MKRCIDDSRLFVGSDPVLEPYRINLIDTPGHVDFSTEVSTASRLCDGALVLVDAVEGVCTQVSPAFPRSAQLLTIRVQTITVLRQTHLSHLRPILVINKIDRLVTELKLSPSEAYHHLARIIEDVNAIVGSFYAGERMEDDWRFRERQEAAKMGDDSDAVDEEYQERDDSNIYFDPANGTVLFSSAIDGWAFRISRFAQLYATKLGMSEANLNRCLWGDWYLDPKTKRVVNRKGMEMSGRKLKPLFVQFILENIWAVYDGVILNKCVSSLALVVAVLTYAAATRSRSTRSSLRSESKFDHRIYDQRTHGIYSSPSFRNGSRSLHRPSARSSTRSLLLPSLKPRECRRCSIPNEDIRTKLSNRRTSSKRISTAEKREASDSESRTSPRCLRSRRTNCPRINVVNSLRTTCELEGSWRRRRGIGS